MYKSIASFLRAHISKLQNSQQRIAVVLHVLENDKKFDNFLNDLPYSRKLIISPVIEGALIASRSAEKLGEEYDLVVFDAREIFNPDALGVVSGVLCGGGCLLLLLPEEKKWFSNSSLFLSHVKNLISNQTGVYYFNNSDSVPDKITIVKGPVASERNILPYKTLDQKKAVELVVESLQSNEDFCAVLTSGRGRGKSSALGFISSHLLKQDGYTILISAPKLSVSNPVFKHLQEQCSQGKMSRGEFLYNNASIRFIAPDLLLEKKPQADVLFIDEAAAIPLSMLQELLSTYKRIVFSTTTHGYEGTGRGFILKFYQLLNDEKPGWYKIELHQPIRWSRSDPLEKWIEDVLFLNVKLDTKPDLPNNISDCKVLEIDRSSLLKNKEKIDALFSLLVFAHYRTSPSDFKYLLDDEKIRIYSLEYKDKVLGVAVINQEGDFDASLSTAIYRGERRPKGHLLAQTLCFHGGCEKAAMLKYGRVMRIAIHPEIQKNGLGSYLLKQILIKEKSLGMDVLGSSFSATAGLLNFWNRAGLCLLRVGFSRDHVSASHSAVVAKALTPKGEKVINSLFLKFKRNIVFWLKGPLMDVSTEIKSYISALALEQRVVQLNKSDLDDVLSYARFNRNYETCMPAINRYINSLLPFSNMIKDSLSENELLIIRLSLQFMNNWKVIVDSMNISGKAQADSMLRSALDHLLELDGY
ncbi:MAG: GNAT family N-acetyltransferase [Gammaproteobacteria bacterium]|nr:GNAT family N-acetyltransferase [Gammaproteobacteria bacterium]